MRPMSAAELAGMQEVAEDSFFDECYLLTLSSSRDAYGEQDDTYTPAATATPCGFRPTGRVQRVGAVLATTEIDAILRVALGTAIGLNSRVRITKRHGVTVPPRDFDVVSEPRRGPSCLVVDLRAVEL